MLTALFCLLQLCQGCYYKSGFSYQEGWRMDWRYNHTAAMVLKSRKNLVRFDSVAVNRIFKLVKSRVSQKLVFQANHVAYVLVMEKESGNDTLFVNQVLVCRYRNKIFRLNWKEENMLGIKRDIGL